MGAIPRRKDEGIIMKIINLTQHAATPEQIDAGVFEPVGGRYSKADVQGFLTFDKLPTMYVVEEHADWLAIIAREHGATHAMIGGAPFLMASLVEALEEAGIKPVYAFSVRESVEENMPDGSVVKRNVFRHAGFVGL
jgi:hypothetical protein